jgi:short-subunit dehydrogenase involved in D-alanine esterification of teichoic acids
VTIQCQKLPQQQQQQQTTPRAVDYLLVRFLLLEHCRLLPQVNNAGVFNGSKWDEQTFNSTLAVNTTGPIAVSQALLPSLAPGALIIMVSSGECDIVTLVWCDVTHLSVTSSVSCGVMSHTRV